MAAKGNGKAYAYASVTPPIANEYTQLSVEVPLALSINQVNYAVMMVSPSDIEDYAVGFCLSQGIIENSNQLRDVCVTHQPDSIIVDIELSPRAGWSFKSQQRKLAGVSGCGLCGVEALEQAIPTLTPLAGATLPSIEVFHALRQRVTSHQHAIKYTGAQHAAVWCDARGEILACREDIGRHNAMDKLIGMLTRNQLDITAGFLVLTSRCGLELVQKAIRAKIATLVTFSAPTSLAVDWAKRYQLNLIHLTHSSEPRVYCGTHVTG